MPAATRLGDGTTGTCNMGLPCCPHGRSGTNGTVSGNVFINGLGAHRRGDTGSTNCPHGGTFASTGASATVFINGSEHTGQFVFTTHNVLHLNLGNYMKEQIYFVTKNPDTLQSELY